MTRKKMLLLSPTKPFFAADLPLPPEMKPAYSSASQDAAMVRDYRRLFHLEARRGLSTPHVYDWDVIKAVRKGAGRVALIVRLNICSPRPRYDNISKLALVMQSVICYYLDLKEKQIVRLDVRQSIDERTPRVEVEICCAY